MDITGNATALPNAVRDGRRLIPDVALVGHTGEIVRFQTDIARDRLVLVNFMSTAAHASNPVSTHLLDVARALGPRLRDDVRMVSVTVDPANDTPEALARFAWGLGAPPGWLFLTGAKAATDLLRGALFRHGADPAQAEDEARRQFLSRVWSAVDGDPRSLLCTHPPTLLDCSMGLVRYGNEAAGIWGSVPARAAPDQILARLSWVQSRPARDRCPAVKRGGPWPGLVRDELD